MDCNRRTARRSGRVRITISMSAAVIEAPTTGARQTYRRKAGAQGRVLVWELFEGRDHD
jgi:hypothetical protein